MKYFKQNKARSDRSSFKRAFKIWLFFGKTRVNFFLGHPEHEAMKIWPEFLCFREFDPDWVNDRLKTIQYLETEWDKIDHDNYTIRNDKYRNK